MSIIHDALKKVQAASPEKSPEKTTPPPASAQGPSPKAPEKTSVPLWVAAACALIAMIFAVLPQITPKQPAATPAPATAPAEPVKPEAAAPQTTTPSTNALAKAVSGAVAVPVVPKAEPPVPPQEQQPQQTIDPMDPLSNIHIEGVIDMGGKKAVLINGNVYEEGQTIRGKIISEVTFETLTIMDDGRKRTFPIKP